MTPLLENQEKMKVLDLFSGIDGFSLGLERTGGFETVAFCEIKEYPRRVLAKHWPGVPIYEDVRELTGARLAADGIAVDVICGGFPCQDISSAGKGAGLAGERSGLWSEYARLIGEARPAFVVVENVAALLSRGLGVVLGDLAALGYDAEWHCIPAAYVGAPHRRDRVWIVAYPSWVQPGRKEQRAKRKRVGARGQSQPLANASRELLNRRGDAGASGRDEFADGRCCLGDADRAPTHAHAAQSPSWRTTSEPGWWITEPDVGRVAHGVPSRVDRLRALGNAVVPQIPEMIGRAILDAVNPKKLDLRE